MTRRELYSLRTSLAFWLAPWLRREINALRADLRATVLREAVHDH